MLFLRFHAREHEVKRERESANNNKCKKVKAPCAKEKTQIHAFFSLCHTALEAPFRNSKPLSNGERKGLE
jgi:hypothetical protein